MIVETVRGLELAKVSSAPRDVPDEEIVGELKPVIRRAEAADFERMRLLGARHDEVMERCAEKIGEHALPMRLVKAEYSFDGSRLTFYFTSEKRVDFRMLVRDLARTFKTRIELRQIGPRDEAKLLGGIGPCGRLLCCATFLPDYARVSIKMAKDQDLPLNPTKISGVCGRLLCCLSYEHDQYLKIKAELPRKGAWVQTPDGPGEVIAVNVIRETVMVELGGSGLHEEFAPHQLSEATQRVGNLARSRAEEGITPFPPGGEGPPKRERNGPPPRRAGSRSTAASGVCCAMRLSMTRCWRRWRCWRRGSPIAMRHGTPSCGRCRHGATPARRRPERRISGAAASRSAARPSQGARKVHPRRRARPSSLARRAPSGGRGPSPRAGSGVPTSSSRIGVPMSSSRSDVPQKPARSGASTSHAQACRRKPPIRPGRPVGCGTGANGAIGARSEPSLLGMVCLAGADGL